MSAQAKKTAEQMFTERCLAAATAELAKLQKSQTEVLDYVFIAAAAGTNPAEIVNNVLNMRRGLK